MTRTALIVGAGIGGLSAGIALRQAGWNIRIFERAASPRELGFGLAVAPNAMLALDELGLAGKVLERGYSPEIARGELRRMDGTVLKAAAFPMRTGLGGPFVLALRPALHGSLLDAVGMDAIALSSAATGFTSLGDRVSLQLADGTSVEGDLLVGADGFGSVIRRALHPSEPPPRSSHIVAVRGAVHGAVHHLHGMAGVYYMGRGVESFLVRASETGIYWALSLAEELVPGGMRDPAAILAHMSPRMDETFRAVTAGTEELRCDELFDRDPLPSWGTGRVTLLGDAAHPVLPHTGQGAAQAMVDAVALRDSLRRESDVARALRMYEGERRPRTAVLVAQGRRTARVMRSMHPGVCYVRELFARAIPAKTVVKLLIAINKRAGTDVSA